MSPAVASPIDSYSNRSLDLDNPRAELNLDVAENDERSAWQAAIVSWFRGQSGAVRVRPCMPLQVASRRVRRPDVTLLDGKARHDWAAKAAPIAVIEILSRDETVRDALRHSTDYEAIGVQTILMIDPTGLAYRARRGRLEPITGEFLLPGSAARFDLNGIRRLID